MIDTDKDWSSVAESDPYWGVLSVEEYRGKSLPQATRERFFSSGDTYIADLFATVAHHFREPFRPTRALDFGCGVGRLTIPISRRATDVVAVDVSSRMRELCRLHVDEAGQSNVTIVESDDVLSKIEGDFDFINSLIVLQHIPPERGYRLIHRLLSCLRVGGTGALQLTYAKSREFLRHETGTARFYRREGRSLIDLVEEPILRPDGAIRMFDYDLNNVFAMLSELSGSPIICLPTNDDRHLGVNVILRRAR